MIQPNIDLLASGSTPDDDLRPARVAERMHDTGRTSPPARDTTELMDLVRRAERGDTLAQSELVRSYTRRIAGFVRAIVRQPDAVEDVTQMVFIKMFRRLSRLRDPALFESWLFTLARNTCLDFLRRCRCRPSTVGLDDAINQIADPSTSTATTEILAALDRALTRLTPLDRTLVRQFVAGETYGDIAERTGLSLATVKVRLHRVRPFLRSWVGEMTDTRLPGGKGWRATSGSREKTRWMATKIAA
jgi:RNA polymerase sigma-70 factor, ECF subfamily